MRLRVDRPVRVWWAGSGWCWRCWLCPPPWQLVTHGAASWLEAVAAADAHANSTHVRSVQPSQAPAGDWWEVAA